MVYVPRKSGKSQMMIRTLIVQLAIYRHLAIIQNRLVTSNTAKFLNLWSKLTTIFKRFSSCQQVFFYYYTCNILIATQPNFTFCMFNRRFFHKWETLSHFLGFWLFCRYTHISTFPMLSHRLFLVIWDLNQRWMLSLRAMKSTNFFY